MAQLIFESTDEQEELPDGSPCQACCEEHGVPFACTEGICGTCICLVTSGMENLTPPTEAERDFLGDEGVKTERMMCQCTIKQGTVRIRN